MLLLLKKGLLLMILRDQINLNATNINNAFGEKMLAFKNNAPFINCV